MAIYTLNKCVTTLLCFLFCFAIVSAQETISEIPLNKQVDLSTQIIEGKVISKESFWDETHSNIYTKQTIQVHKVFKGQAFETVEVITKGGVVDLEAQVVSHSLHLNNGDVGLFVLKQHSSNIQSNRNNSFQTVSDAQSFYKYNLDKNSAVNAFNNIQDIDKNLYSKLEQHTNRKFLELKPLKISQSSKTGSISLKSSFAPIITSFSTNNITAGTKSTIIINGSNFGTTKGTVGFSDANYGGALFYNALENQIISWSNTQIEVEVPDRAGTGPIEVTTSGSQSILSSQNLTIDFAQVNLEYANDAYQTQHVDNNSNGGNTWTMNQDFFNSDAKEAFERAIESWTCSTGINWEIDSNTTSINTNANDGINIITFDPTMSGGTLGQCYSSYSGCYEGGEIKWYVTDMDIILNGNKNWNFTTNPPAYNQVDFESVIVHELGHGHQLGHVIDTNVVMHYSISAGESLRVLSTDDLMGAEDVQSRSTTTTVCSQLSMTNYECLGEGSGLSIADNQLESDITLYPNPAKSNLYIKNSGYQNIDRVSVFNVVGKEIYTTFNSKNSRVLQLDLSRYARGVYLVKINSEIGTVTKKLVVN
ncbi:T9SS type A sorting domain-containing protein [uncultured Algibacter sp.]|uniref:T9SS type A sorting domain-containing protein n=1 Tax=uncultured Algibacter sp. TaxID=298659 RepID=UPI00262548DD|nr:T9SS type A sorting domain-containing protein [uncultured Algibacter sp.]